jgi:hypothetical protein
MVRKKKPKNKIEKEELIKIQTAQSFFLQPPNKTHKDKSKYNRKTKYKKDGY